MTTIEQARKHHQSPYLINQHHYTVALSYSTANDERVWYAAVTCIHRTKPPTTFELVIDIDCNIDNALQIIDQIRFLRNSLTPNEREHFDAKESSIIQK